MERFVNDILAECPGCPESIIKRKVLQSAIRFCDKSWAWQEKVSIEVVEDDETIAIALVNDATVAGVACAMVNEVGFTAFTRELDVLTFDDAATENFTLDLTVAIKPARDVSSLENIFVDDWYDGIEIGAKAALMAMAGKPWFNPQLSSFYLTQARGYIVDAKINANKKNDVKDLRVNPRRFV